MRKFLLKRIGTSLIILFGVSIIVFILINSQPGNPYSGMIDPRFGPEVFEAKLQELGYYDPMPIKYLKWIGRVFAGDLGYSIKYKAPVMGLIVEALKNTFLISIISFAISSVFAITLGIISAEKAKTWVDYIITFVTFLGISVPTFVFGLFLVKWLSYDLKLLPPSGIVTITANYKGMDAILDIARHMVMPVAVLSITQTAVLLRYTRSSVIDSINQDYIRTAMAKGRTRSGAIWTHGVRNSLISIITILCMQLPGLFSGALITETIFVWPGIGTLNYNAINNRDYPMIMGITMMIAVVIVFANLLADVLYMVADPRVKNL